MVSMLLKFDSEIKANMARLELLELPKISEVFDISDIIYAKKQNKYCLTLIAKDEKDSNLVIIGNMNFVKKINKKAI